MHVICAGSLIKPLSLRFFACFPDLPDLPGRPPSARTPSRIRQLSANLIFIADLSVLPGIWRSKGSAWVLGAHTHTHTHQPTRLTPTADSPAATLTKALGLEVLSQVHSAYKGLRGLFLCLFPLTEEKCCQNWYRMPFI
jgi:hypothetical protein